MSKQVKNAIKIAELVKEKSISVQEAQRQLGLNKSYLKNVRIRIKKGLYNATEEEKEILFGNAIKDFCETKGLELKDVKHFWYKGQHVGKDSVSAFLKNDEIKRVETYLNDNILLSLRDLEVPNLPKIKGDEKLRDVVLELNMYDCHFGKKDFLSDEGTKETVERFEESISHFVDFTLKNYNIKSIILAIGNDIFNVDNLALTTTKGTPQDNDLSYEKMFLIVQKTVIETILFLDTIAPVDVLMVRGNHDYISVFMLGQVLEAYFSKIDTIKVQNSLGRSIRFIGNTAVGFSHGENDILKNPAIIYKEFQREIFEYQQKTGTLIEFFEWHCGHWHGLKTTIQENMGIITRFFSSLSVNDRWHYKEGYIGNRISASALIHDTKQGVLSTQTITF